MMEGGILYHCRHSILNRFTSMQRISMLEITVKTRTSSKPLMDAWTRQRRSEQKQLKTIVYGKQESVASLWNSRETQAMHGTIHCPSQGIIHVYESSHALMYIPFLSRGSRITNSQRNININLLKKHENALTYQDSAAAGLRGALHDRQSAV